MANRNATGASLKKLRGYKQRQLIRHLATGDKTQNELAEKYDVAQSTISYFAKQHADEIAAVKANLDDEFAGMWIADKANRVQEYEESLARIKELSETDPNPNWEKVAQSALRSVAEELGQLPNRYKIEHSDQKVHIVVEGADTDKLT